VFTAAGLYPIEVTYFNGDWTSDGTGAKLNHSGNPDPSVHGGANFHLRVNGATVTPAFVANLFPPEAVPSPVNTNPPPAATLTISNAGPTTVQIRVQGGANATYQIESSTDLRTFTPLTSVRTDAAGRAVITVPKSTHQFFRAVGVAGGAAITSVAETGGDNEATDTVPAKWTGQTWVSGIANEPVNGLRTNDSFTARLFGHEVPAYVDRNHQFEGSATNVALPTYLVGGEYIMSGNDNRDNATYQLLVTLARQADVFMLIDNRLGDANGTNGPSFTTNMTWIVSDGGWTTVTNGFHRSGSATMPDEVGIDEGADGTLNQWFTVYRKRFPAGSVTLRQADNTGQNMYGVVIRPAP
jgi:hypothetical protein